MIFTELPLRGAYRIDLSKKEDERGFFARFFCEKEFQGKRLNTQWVQMNNSMSKLRGTIRGLHFQYPPYAEVKLVRCFRGAIWDVIVDIRKDSDTYGKWYGTELNEENRSMMYVPKGFAHGFISLTDNSEILYLVSTPYTQSAEGTLRWNDPFQGIHWPIEPVVISEKDALAKDWNSSSGVIIDQKDILT
jgi:dTDP-4-dehydrorhamnose 3,5-epimerase